MAEIIGFSDWQKLDLRTAKILTVDSIEGADKLYKLILDLGKELGKRTLVAGLKQYYKPEELKGKAVVVFTNLEPKKLRGVESQGMLLAAQDEEGIVVLTLERHVKEGSRVK